MMDGLITGRLTGTPEHRSDRNRRPFMVARVRSEASDGTSIPVNVVAFDAQACEVLRNLIEGDAVALRGSFTPKVWICLLYTSPSPRDQRGSRMPSSA